ncbi:MAG: hypothetical protein U9N13_01400 [Euryarchaeota archaeon]|nr:hypothetical protein [Euryarchaeota archaeon]
MLPYYVGIFKPDIGVHIMAVSLIMQNGIMLGIVGYYCILVMRAREVSIYQLVVRGKDDLEQNRGTT